ncbi:MAG: hypothetical protein LUQ22_07950 [Methanotrichaceae archaeon]|nr:hypothetical protein [Methanotrichaceae archaeon]
MTSQKSGACDATKATKSCAAVPRKPLTKPQPDEMLVLDEKSRLKFRDKALVQDMNARKES